MGYITANKIRMSVRTCRFQVGTTLGKDGTSFGLGKTVTDTDKDSGETKTKTKPNGMAGKGALENSTGLELMVPHPFYIKVQE